MGLFNKIKDILFEEETVEIPVVDQKEELKKIQDQIKTNKENEKEKKFELPKEKWINEKEDLPKYQKKDEIKERELYKSEPTFPFPLAFDEEPEIPSRTKTHESYPKKQTIKKEKETKVKKNTELKEFDLNKHVERNSTPFRPSPIISPVYGILDKNYKKEDLIQRKKTNDNIDIDKVRQKAFGENSILKDEEIIIESEDSKTVDELLIDTLSINLENLEKKKDDKNKDKELADEEKFNNKKENQKEENEKSEAKTITKDDTDSNEDKKSIDDTLETDLFNLIDSMYDEKGGE